MSKGRETTMAQSRHTLGTHSTLYKARNPYYARIIWSFTARGSSPLPCETRHIFRGKLDRITLITFLSKSRKPVFFKRLHVRLSNNPKIRGKRYSGRKRNNNPSFNQRTLAVFQKNFHIVHVARSSRSISGPRLSGRKACLVHARRRGEEGGSVYVFIQKREDINRPSFQFLCDRILGIGNIRHFSTTRSTRTIPPPIYRFIPPVKKRKRKWPRNYTIGENSSAATRSIFLHKPVQLLYPRGTANILQPGPRGNRFPSLPVPRAAPISSRSEPEPPVAIPVQPNPTCSSRIYIFQRGLRSPSEPGRGICTSDNVQRSKMHRRGSRVGEDGWIFMIFLSFFF